MSYVPFKMVKIVRGVREPNCNQKRVEIKGFQEKRKAGTKVL